MNCAKHFLVFTLCGTLVGVESKLLDGPVGMARKPTATESRQVYQEPEILIAIRSNNLAKVKELVEIAKIDINARYSDPDRSIPGAQYIMDPNRNNLYDYTALIEAARVNNLEIAKYLVEKRADVNVVAYMLGGNVKKSALDYAKQNNNPEMVKLLEQKNEPVLKAKKTESENLADLENRTNEIEKELKAIMVLPQSLKKEIADMLVAVENLANRPTKKMVEGPAADAWIAEENRISALKARLEKLIKQIQ